MLRKRIPVLCFPHCTWVRLDLSLALLGARAGLTFHSAERTFSRDGLHRVLRRTWTLVHGWQRQAVELGQQELGVASD